MNPYQPLDLSNSYNAGTDVIPPGLEVETGAVDMRGLPFQIGGGEGNCFIALDGSAGPVTIPVGGSARQVIFAHGLLETSVPLGGPLGIAVADYVFHLSGGREERVPVRERYEIASMPIPGAIFGVPARPFRAVIDEQDRLPPRSDGAWEETGRRQTEVAQGMLKLYHLWAWKNPQPEAAVESIEIVPRGPRFIVAAITLGQLDEYPFVKQRRRPVKVTLDGDAADAPFDVDVEVDRGVATYAFALPEASDEEFLADSFKGWGEPQNEKASPSYVEVAATPSATVTVKQDGREVAEAEWGEVEEKGVVETPGARFELLDRGGTGSTSPCWTTTRGSPCPAGSTSALLKGSPTSRTATTTRSTRTSGPGTSTWAAT